MNVQIGVARCATSITAGRERRHIGAGEQAGRVTISRSEGAPGVYRVHITTADVGRRVALRRVLDDGREGLGDVLGELLSWEAGVLVVRTRDGAEVSVEERHLLAGRRIPAPPIRRTAAP